MKLYQEKNHAWAITDDPDLLQLLFHTSELCHIRDDGSQAVIEELDDVVKLSSDNERLGVHLGPIDTLSVFKETDWESFKRQKVSLLKIITSYDDIMSDDLNGILNWIDAVQDELVELEFFTEKQIFGALEYKNLLDIKRKHEGALIRFENELKKLAINPLRVIDVFLYLEGVVDEPVFIVSYVSTKNNEVHFESNIIQGIYTTNLRDAELKLLELLPEKFPEIYFG